MSPKDFTLSQLPPELREEFLEALRALGIVRDDDELIRISALLSIVLRAFAREGENHRDTAVRFIAELKSKTDEAKIVVDQLREAGRHGVTWKAVVRAKVIAGLVLAAFTAIGAYAGAKVVIWELSQKLADISETVAKSSAVSEQAAKQLADGQAAVKAYSELAEKYRTSLLMGAVMARALNATPKANVSFYNDEIVIAMPPGMVSNVGSSPEYDLFRIHRDIIGAGVDGSNFQQDMEKLEAAKNQHSSAAP